MTSLTIQTFYFSFSISSAMTFFIVTCIFAWVFSGFSVPTTQGAPHYHDLAVQINPLQQKETVHRLAGESPAHPNEFPFQASLEARDEGKWSHICSGVVIAEDKVVTAAHCIYHSDPADLRVVAGEHKLTVTEDTEQILGIYTAICHPKYDSRTMDYDYGVLELSSNLTFNKYVRAIPLAAEGFQWSDDCISNGWGSICGSEGWPILGVLYKARLPIVSRANYSELYEGVGNVTERMICAGGAGVGRCHVESGSSLVCNGNLTGILSWDEFLPAKGRLPTVFASVAAERVWILSQ